MTETKGIPTWAVLDLPAYYAADKLAQYAPADIRTFITGPSNVYYFGWDGGNHYHYGEYEAHLARLVRAKPDIRLILWVGSRIGAPHRWCRTHENELVRTEAGLPVRAGSLASPRWQAESTAAVRALVEHFEDGPFADHIVGYNPVFIGCAWRGLGETRDALGIERGPVEEGFVVPGDYSGPMVRAFRAWLRGRYLDDPDAVSKAWKTPVAAFDEIALPTGEEKTAARPSTFASECPYPAPKVIDYYRFYNELNAQFALGWCRAVKEGSRGRKRCGMIHGLTFPTVGCFHGEFPLAHGYAAPRAILESPDVDYLHAPYSGYRRAFGGAHASQHAIASVMLHGKQYLEGLDPRTDHQRGPVLARSPWESEQVLKRDYAFALCRGAGACWWDPMLEAHTRHSGAHDFERMTFDTPALKSLLAQLRRLEGDGSGSAAEVALFRSTESLFEHGLGNAYEDLFVNGLRNWVLPELGAPVDEYLLEDLPRVQRSYRLLIFPDALRVSLPLREAVHARLRADGATALWFYGAGYVSDDGPSLTNCEQLTGIRLGRTGEGAALALKRASVRPLDPSLFEEGCLPRHRDFDGYLWPSAREAPYRFAPVFHADDPEADTRDLLAASGLPGYVVKSMDGWRSAWLGAPMPKPGILRELAREAGVHLYADDGSTVYAGNGFLALIAREDGALHVALPHAGVRLTDAFTGEPVDLEVSSGLNMRRGEVRLLAFAR